jgi:hypothetical protein
MTTTGMSGRGRGLQVKLAGVILLSHLGVSCFLSFGNAQDGGLYGSQGSVVQNQALYEQEQARAAAEARQTKALKDAMAAQSPIPPVATTAEQYLRINGVPVASSRDGAEYRATAPTGAPLETRGASIPPVPNRSGASVPSFVTAPASPPAAEKKKGLFGWLPGKVEPTPAAPAANPYVPTAPADGIAVQEATMAAVNAPVRETGQPGLMGGLFGRKEKESSGSSAVPPAAEGDLFERRAKLTAGAVNSVAVPQTFEAEFAGVLVTVYAGTSVIVLDRSEKETLIQLPDGRSARVPSEKLGPLP